MTTACVPRSILRTCAISRFPFTGFVRDTMQDWDTLVKMVMAAYQKIPDVHWATYQAVYGQEGGT